MTHSDEYEAVEEYRVLKGDGTAWPDERSAWRELQNRTLIDAIERGNSLPVVVETRKVLYGPPVRVTAGATK